jgi:hypothetical protein
MRPGQDRHSPGRRPGQRRRGEGAGGERSKTPWWAVTATGIHPVGVAEGADRTTLARATARLCHQTVARFDRSRCPALLCAAGQCGCGLVLVKASGGVRRV